MSTTDINNACDNQAYTNLVKQRKRALLFNIPPARYNNLDSNPYTKINPSTGSYYTKYELDMRRKAEVLKYQNNTSNSKSNNLTKSQRWAQLVSGKYQRRTYSQYYLEYQASTDTCPVALTPTSASNVPGNGYLYDDESIPLYNYMNDATTNAVYASVQKEVDTMPWRYTYTTDAFCTSSTAASPQFTTFATINILNVSLLETAYTFSVSVPFTLYVQCDAKPGAVESIVQYRDISAVELWFSEQSPVTFGLFYSDSICTIPPPTISIDMSMNYSQQVPVNIDASMTLYPSGNPLSSGNQFYVYNYMGVIHVDNIIAQTQPGYIYDMALAVNFNTRLSNNYTTYFANPKIGLYLNSQYSTTQITSYHARVTNPTPILEANMPQFAIGSNGV